MIGLKAKSENETDLSYDINLLHTLKLMLEAVLNSSFCHCMFCLFSSSSHILWDAHFYCLHMTLQSWMTFF